MSVIYVANEKVGEYNLHKIWKALYSANLIMVWLEVQ